MDCAKKYIRLVDSIVESICILLITCLLGVTFVQIIARYVFNSPLSWSEELARLMFIWLSLLGSSVALRKNLHVSFSLVTLVLPVRAEYGIRVFTNALIAATLIIILPPSFRFSLFMNTIPSAGLEWPMGIFYVSVSVASVLMILNLVTQMVVDVRYLLGKEGK